MHTRDLVLTLEDDAIFTRSGGTVGRPESLGQPTGASIAGALASTLYSDLGERAFAAFHLAGVRISDGLPLAGDRVALPIPLSWHSIKTGDGTQMFDLSHDRPSGQLSQQRDDWVVARHDGTWERRPVERRTSMRTAIDGEVRAREGLLFGFEAIPAGQRYLVTITAESRELLDLVVTTLSTHHGFRLGRSRSAEYGRVTFAACDVPGPLSGDVTQTPLRLLCLGDLALRDPATGQPTTCPTPEALGLNESWRVVLDRSFLRTRRYSPWNGHRQRPDLERQVIVAGSVITLEPQGDAQLPDGWAARLAAGVGEYTGVGLGRILVNPAVLSQTTQHLNDPEEAPEPSDAAPTIPGDHLGTWLAAQVKAMDRIDRTWSVAEDQANALARKSRTTSSAQWGQIRATAASWVGRDSPDERTMLLQALRDQVGGVSWDAWGSQGKELFGKRKVQRITAGTDGGRARPGATPEQSVTFDGGLFDDWRKDDTIDFARAIQILARRVVRVSAQRSDGGAQ